MRRLLFIVVVGSVLLSGCASSMSGSAYERRQGRAVQDVQLGTVEHVREVLIEGTKTGIGAAAGAATGSIIGSGGRGRSSVGSAVAGIAGAVVGGVAGAAAEEGATRQKGLEITVRLENGRLIAVTQAADEAFNVGDRVRILSGQGTTRVTH
jgi:outer membrane lipoprotein SlyB